MPKTKKKTSKRKPNPAFMRPVKPDDKLAAIVGSQPLPRSELTKKLWKYIKKHGLQDKRKGTQIHTDSKLRRVVKGKSGKWGRAWQNRVASKLRKTSQASYLTFV